MLYQLGPSVSREAGKYKGFQKMLENVAKSNVLEYLDRKKPKNLERQGTNFGTDSNQNVSAHERNNENGVDA